MSTPTRQLPLLQQQYTLYIPFQSVMFVLKPCHDTLILTKMLRYLGIKYLDEVSWSYVVVTLMCDIWGVGWNIWLQLNPLGESI